MAVSTMVIGERGVIGFGKVTVGAAPAAGFAEALYRTFDATTKNRSQATHLVVTVETDAIRVRFDGVDPDATTGHLVEAGQSFEVFGYSNIKNTRMIRVTGDATLQVSAYGA